MSSTLGRIGKSLVKYFKPIRVTPPHHQKKDSSHFESLASRENPQQDLKKGFKLIKFKKPATPTPEETEDLALQNEQSEIQSLSVAKSTPGAQKAPMQWIELVVGLLAACRRASQKMRRKMGIETYRKSIMARGQNKIQSLGSIVDTTTVLRDEIDPKKAA